MQGIVCTSMDGGESMVCCRARELQHSFRNNYLTFDAASRAGHQLFMQSLSPSYTKASYGFHGGLDLRVKIS